MKRRQFLFALALCGAFPTSLACAQTTTDPKLPMKLAPKRLLVVTTTAGFRHSSIGIGEKTLQEFADQTGEFTLDWVRQPKDKADLKSALLPLAPANLANYDGIVFLSTTGDLPIPDRNGFLQWIREGHAFIGIHASTDTFHGWGDFIQMQGGEFKTHGAQNGADVRVVDTAHPATKGLDERWQLKREELYQFKNLAPDNRELLVLDEHPNDGTPGHYPLAWTRSYGEGRVFYSALGHRDDLWSLDADMNGRVNPVETSERFRSHILGGIRWALGQE